MRFFSKFLMSFDFLRKSSDFTSSLDFPQGIPSPPRVERRRIIASQDCGVRSDDPFEKFVDFWRAIFVRLGVRKAEVRAPLAPRLF